MNRYKVWHVPRRRPTEYIFADHAYEARQTYAQKHHVSVSDVMARKT